MDTAADRRPDNLRTLYEAGLILSRDLTLEAVLQRVVDLARELAGARYGALGIFGAQDQIEQFVTSGITPEERSRMGPLPRGRGLLGEMLKADRPLLVPTISQHPASTGFPRGHPQMTSFLGVPVLYRARGLGVLYLTDKEGAQEFSEEDADLVQLFAAQAAAAVENARLHAQTEQQAEKLQELYRAGLAISSDLSLETVLQRVIDLARELTDATYGALGVLDGSGKELERFITSGLSQQERARLGDPPRGRGLLGEMLQSTQPLRLKDLKQHPASVGFPEGHPPMTSFLGVPVIQQGRVLGSLYLTDKRGAEEFTEADAGLLVLFAGQAGLAIENARLHAGVQELYRAVAAERTWLTTVIEGAPVGILLFQGAGGEQVVTNRRAEELFGMTLVRDRGVGQHANRVCWPDGRPLAFEELPAARALRGDEVAGEELLIRRPDGSALPALAFSQGIRDASGVIIGAATVLEDITLLKQVERLQRERAGQAAVEEERQRLARELHDGLAQVLGYVNVKAGAVQRLLEQGRSEEAAREVQQLAGAARGAYADIREDVLGLRTMMGTGIGLLASVRAYADQFQVFAGIPVEVDVKAQDDDFTWAPAVEIQLIRVIQEALSNVRKHSGAGRAWVRLVASEDSVLVSIQDDGHGISGGAGSGDSTHFGLEIMRERAQSLGGSLEVESAPGKGTTVRVRIPREVLRRTDAPS